MDDFKEIAKFQFESAQARLERIITRLWVLCLLLVVLLVVSNGVWIYYASQIEVEEKTIVKQEVEADDGNVLVMDGIHLNDVHE